MANSRIGLRIALGICILAGGFVSVAGEDRWIELKTPNFTIISNASLKKAGDVATSLERYRTAFQAAVPGFKVDSVDPLVAFAVQGSDTLRSLLSSSKDRNAVQRMGSFLATPEKNFIVVRVDVPVDEHYHVIYHEYAHAIVRLNLPNLPIWIAEGLAELFGSAAISNRSSSFGNVSPSSFRILRSSPMIPLKTLMTARPDSPFYSQQGLSEIFYAQSFALTHYLMLGDDRAHVQQLYEYLRLLQNEGEEPNAAEAAFGDLSALQRKLERYVGLPAFSRFKATVHIPATDSRYPQLTLFPEESLTYRGLLLTNTNRLDAAKAFLEQALELNPKNASANEAMGWLYFRLKIPIEAKRYFSTAAELDSKSFLAHYYMAELEYERGGNYEIAEKALRKALAIRPDSLPACEMLAYVLTADEAKLPEALELATKLASLEPDQPKHRILATRILFQMGRDAEAQAAAEQLLAKPLTEGERRQAESLLSRLKQRRDKELHASRQMEILQEQLKLVEEQRRKDKDLEEQIRSDALLRKLNAETGKIKTGPARRVMGSIQSVKCSDPAIMDLVLDTRGKQIAYKLRAKNYYKIQYWVLGTNGMMGFQPCRDLKGKDAIVKFLRVSGQEFAGLIQSIEFEN